MKNKKPETHQRRRGIGAEMVSSRMRLEEFSFPSMEACEGQTGIPKTMQQMAKAKGCMAFRTTRVYLLELVAWIFKESVEGNTSDWGKLNAELDVKLKQIKLDLELRRVITRDEAQKFAQEFAGLCFGELKRQMLESPRDYESRSKLFIKKLAEEKYEAIMERLRTELAKFKEAEPKSETISA